MKHALSSHAENAAGFRACRPKSAAAPPHRTSQNFGLRETAAGASWTLTIFQIQPHPRTSGIWVCCCLPLRSFPVQRECVCLHSDCWPGQPLGGLASGRIFRRLWRFGIAEKKADLGPALPARTLCSWCSLGLSMSSPASKAFGNSPSAFRRKRLRPQKFSAESERTDSAENWFGQMSGNALKGESFNSEKSPGQLSGALAGAGEKREGARLEEARGKADQICYKKFRERKTWHFPPPPGFFGLRRTPARRTLFRPPGCPSGLWALSKSIPGFCQKRAGGSSCCRAGALSQNCRTSGYLGMHQPALPPLGFGAGAFLDSGQTCRTAEEPYLPDVGQRS